MYNSVFVNDKKNSDENEIVKNSLLYNNDPLYKSTFALVDKVKSELQYNNVEQNKLNLNESNSKPKNQHNAINEMCDLLIRYLIVYKKLSKEDDQVLKKAQEAEGEILDLLTGAEKIEGKIEGKIKGRIEGLLNNMHSFIHKFAIDNGLLETTITTDYSKKSLKYFEKLFDRYKTLENKPDKSVDFFKEYIENGRYVNEQDITANNILAYLEDENTFKNRGWGLSRIFSPRRRRFNALYKALEKQIQSRYGKTKFKEIKKATKCFSKIDNDTQTIITNLFNDADYVSMYSSNNIHNGASRNGLKLLKQEIANGLNNVVSCG